MGGVEPVWGDNRGAVLPEQSVSRNLLNFVSPELGPKALSSIRHDRNIYRAGHTLPQPAATAVHWDHPGSRTRGCLLRAPTVIFRTGERRRGAANRRFCVRYRSAFVA